MVMEASSSENYQAYRHHHQEMYTTLEKGFSPQEGYQTLTDHRNSTKEIMGDVDDEEYGDDYDCDIGRFNRREGNRHSSSYNLDKRIRDSIFNDQRSKEDDDVVYFETEEIYHDPNALNETESALTESENGVSAEPFYFQTDYAVDHKKAHRLSSILRLEHEGEDGVDGCCDDDIYMNDGELKSDGEGDKAEEEEFYANSPRFIDGDGIKSGEFDTDFSSFTIV